MQIDEDNKAGWNANNVLPILSGPSSAEMSVLNPNSSQKDTIPCLYLKRDTRSRCSGGCTISRLIDPDSRARIKRAAAFNNTEIADQIEAANFWRSPRIHTRLLSESWHELSRCGRGRSQYPAAGHNPEECDRLTDLAEARLGMAARPAPCHAGGSLQQLLARIEGSEKRWEKPFRKMTIPWNDADRASLAFALSLREIVNRKLDDRAGRMLLVEVCKQYHHPVKARKAGRVDGLGQDAEFLKLSSRNFLVYKAPAKERPEQFLDVELAMPLRPSCMR